MTFISRPQAQASKKARSVQDSFFNGGREKSEFKCALKQFYFHNVFPINFMLIQSYPH